MTTGATLQPAPPVVRPWHRVVRRGLDFAKRLNHASRLLVVLIAASVVAMLVSLGVQSRLAAAPLDLPGVPVAREASPQEPVESAEPAPPPEPAPVVVAAIAPPAAPEIVRAPPAEPAAAPPPAEPAPATTGFDPEDAAKWHRLRRGMSRTAVRMIFGYPQWIDRRSTPRTEYWLYTSERVADGGWIAFFDGEGPVASWRQP